MAKSYEVGERVVPVIGDLSLTLDNGQIVSIVREWGCGERTLLDALCELLTPDTGRISWYGARITGQPQNVGYMLQKDLLLPWRSGLGNVMLGLKSAAWRHEAKRSQPRDAMSWGSTSSPFTTMTLSGGMRKSVAMVRTLVNEPEMR